MRYLPIIILIALSFIPIQVSAGGAVIVVVDALGSSYLSPHEASYMSGGTIPPVDVKAFDRANAQYQLKVSVPSTEFGHAVIVTGYSNASEQTVAYYHSTVFDVLRDDGYLTFGIMENGDTPEMLCKLDAAVHNMNESIYNPDYEFIENSRKVPTDIVRMMSDYPRTPPDEASKGAYASYINYNAWGLDFTRNLVQYMAIHHPDRDYFLIVNIGGLDSAGHNLGCDGYQAVLSGIDGDMNRLVDVCKASGTALMITGDHGMSFKNESAKGAHASLNVAYRKESLMVPLFIYSNVTARGEGLYGQESIAPTLLALLDEPNIMSLSDGEPLPVKEKPTLYLTSKEHEDVTITGPNFNRTVSFSGLYRIKGLEKGDYVVSYGSVQRTVHLDHDEIVDLREDERSPPTIPPWMGYLAVAGISIAGISIALTLAWTRR